MTKIKPFILIILDGWGARESNQYNAITTANTPTWDALWKNSPHTLISGSGTCVGLPEGQMGNSEVGHLNLGLGRMVRQDFSHINEEIANGQFYKNPAFIKTCQMVKSKGKALHVLGLLSPGGVHSHEEHLFALLKLAKEEQIEKIYFHAFLDGRDTPPKSALASLQKLDTLIKTIGVGKIVSLVGRYYAMDRDKRWDRIQKAYDLLTLGRCFQTASSATEALELAYKNEQSDEFVEPTCIHAKNESPVTIEDGDAIIFMNFRADRARELTHAFLDNDFHEFYRARQPKLSAFVSLTSYAKNLPTLPAYPPASSQNGLGEYLSKHHLRQLRIAETEKYAHVTFFFNGGIEEAYPLEERILIPSLRIATYDLEPAMSAPQITDTLVKVIHEEQYDVIICNFANPDMVGHTGNFAATVKAVEEIDRCLTKIKTAIDEVHGEMLITADHGNAEYMFNEKTNQPHTAHTSDPVPLIYYGRPAKFIIDDGKLSDVAPTLLYLMDIKPPKEMTGRILLTLKE